DRRDPAAEIRLEAHVPDARPGIDDLAHPLDAAGEERRPADRERVEAGLRRRYAAVLTGDGEPGDLGDDRRDLLLHVFRVLLHDLDAGLLPRAPSSFARFDGSIHDV